MTEEASKERLLILSVCCTSSCKPKILEGAIYCSADEPRVSDFMNDILLPLIYWFINLCFFQKILDANSLFKLIFIIWWIWKHFLKDILFIPSLQYHCLAIFRLFWKKICFIQSLWFYFPQGNPINNILVILKQISYFHSYSLVLLT